MTEFSTPIIQAGSSARYTAAIVSDGADVLLAQITSMVLTITDKDEAIINSRSAQSILNTNGGTVTDGELVLVLNGNDTARQSGDPSRTQARWLHIKVVLTGGAEIIHEVLWYVQGNHIAGDD